jgi:hypothetical protein
MEPQRFGQQLPGVQRFPATGRDYHLRVPGLDGLHEPIYRGLRALSWESLGPPSDTLGIACRRERRLDLRVHNRVHHGHGSLSEPSEMGSEHCKDTGALQVRPSSREDRGTRFTHAISPRPLV